MIQPIIVRRYGDGFQLIAGERRWRAARQAGLERIPAIVRDATDAQSIEIALVENLLREDLNPIETAQAYQKLLAEFGWTQEELAKRAGIPLRTLQNWEAGRTTPRPSTRKKLEALASGQGQEERFARIEARLEKIEHRRAVPTARPDSRQRLVRTRDRGLHPRDRDGRGRQGPHAASWPPPIRGARVARGGVATRPDDARADHRQRAAR